jgi:hypothetical protein
MTIFWAETAVGIESSGMALGIRLGDGQARKKKKEGTMNRASTWETT